MLDKEDEIISRLLLNALLGKLTPEEEELLDLWRKQSDAHEQLYRRVHDIGRLEREYRQRKAVDVQRPMAEMERRIRAEKKPQQRILWWRWAAAAVVILLCAVGGMHWWLSDLEGDNASIIEMSVARADSIIRPGETKATLLLADGQEVELGRDDTVNREAWQRSVAKAATNTSSESRQLCLDVPRGGEFKVVLEDSTVVWLNSESRLTYPESFSGSERRVAVSGEAYFEVARDETRPFYVETDGQLVRVYGTEFNVRSYSEDNEVYTTLVSGSIALCKADGQSGELLLTPGHQARFDKTEEDITVRTVDTEVVTGWRHGRFVFEDQNLEQIMCELSRWYDFDYRFEEEALRQIVFMGSIPRYSEFSTALGILEKSGGLRFEVQGTTIVIDRSR